jgi:cadmium resistance protein CadD (predicted permease)
MDLTLASLGTAFAVFVSTNVDDIVLLAALFADPHLRPRAIVAGQLIGMVVLTGASAAAAYAALAVPPRWIALLGIVPFGLGLIKLWQLLRRRAPEDDADGAVEAEHALEGRLHSQILGVAAITISNGGDNLGVYIPVFANDASSVPLFPAVFMVLTVVWCAVGYALVNNPAGRAVVHRCGHVLLPIVLIAVGLLILLP